MAAAQLSEFGEILVFFIVSVLFIAGGLVTAWLVRPSRPNPEKLKTYESGEEPMGGAWIRFPIRFYLVAIIFLLFEVEIVFLFPWATVFGRKELIDQTNGLWGWYSLIEMFVFIVILALGLAYAWVKGFLDWPKVGEEKTNYESHIPKSLYDKVNEKYSN